MIDSVSLSTTLRAPGVDLAPKSAQVSAAVGPDFGTVLADVTAQAVDTVRAGEAAAVSGLRGAAPIQDVVEAVMSAERSLQTGLALRDKAVSAYQEISRMQI